MTQQASSLSPYKLSAIYNASNNFFNFFTFDTEDDPTHGFVDFVNRTEAEELKLISYTEGNQVYIGSDYVNVIPLSSRGRKSIRLNSNLIINGNTLLIIDLDHLPSTNVSDPSLRGCSTWPAWWTCGSDWPKHGEIDIIEYINADSVVTTTLHTDGGCSQSQESNATYTGTMMTADCDVSDPYQDSNAGCGILGPPKSVGYSFNSGGGGVYAMQW